MRVGVYGGTFNPIHNGHVALVRQMLAALCLDELLLIPTASPPHKGAQEVVEGFHRLEMCRLATADLPAVRVSGVEIARGGKSYTVDTLRRLLAERPHDSFYLLMGSDMLYTLAEWREAEALMRMVPIAAAAREPDEQQKLLDACAALNERYGARAIAIDAPALPMSSTALREDAAEGRPLEAQLPASVADYIAQNGLYGHRQRLPLDLDELTAMLRARLSRERFTHTLNVAGEALRLAAHYGENKEEAYLAGLLHDSCKELDEAEMLNLLVGSAIIKDQAFLKSPKVWHGFAAAIYIQRELSVRNAQIIEAVRYHTTGRGEMSRLEELVYLADLISAERDYPGVEALRATAYRSVPQAMLEALTFSVRSLCAHAAPVMTDTLNAYNRYALLLSQSDAQGVRAQEGADANCGDATGHEGLPAR